MAYNENIPQPRQALSSSQGNLLDNFAAIFTYLGVDHNQFDTPNAGKHNKVTFTQVQPADVDVPNGSIALYNRQFNLTGVNELFKVNSFGADEAFDKEFPMTASTQLNEGWSYLPSGLLLKWGTQNKTGQANIIYPADVNTIPAFQVALYSMVIIKNNAGTDPNLAVTLLQNGLNGISVYVSNRTNGNAATADVSYLSIGF